MTPLDETAAAPMLRRFGSLKHSTIAATDDAIGTFEDFYFDDESWTVRHLVVETGGWLSGRRVLISPRSISAIDRGGRHLQTRLTRSQVERSPDVDTARPVSRRHEALLSHHFGFPDYWAGPYRWGDAALPTGGPVPAAGAGYVEADRILDERQAANPHVHSAIEVTGYGIEARDGELGHVEDFLIDEASWAIRYVIVDPRNWWPGEHVLIGIDWFSRVNWDQQTVRVELTREAVRNAPAWSPDNAIDRGWETRLHAHYGRRGYWERPDDSYLLWSRAA